MRISRPAAGIISLCICALVSYGACSVELQPTLLPPLTLMGTTTLMQSIQTAQDAVNKSVEEFKPINATCTTIIEQKVAQCAECVKSKCEQRIKDISQSCADPLTAFILDLINFGQQVGNFFSSMLPNFVVDTVGGHIMDGTQQIDSFFTGTLVDGLNQLGDGVINIGEQIGSTILDIGGFFEGLSNDILSGLTDAGDFLLGTTLDIGNAIGDLFGNLGSNIGDFFGGLGRRRRTLYVKTFNKMMLMKQGEPGCDDFADEESAQRACMYYVTKCADCDLDKDRDCPGYKTAFDKVLAAANDAKWLSGIKELKYGVKSAKYNPAAFDPAALGYRDVEVSVDILGSSASLVLPEAINVFDAQNAGPVIANHAIDWFKQTISKRR